jgi:hypothetical protein
MEWPRSVLRPSIRQIITRTNKDWRLFAASFLNLT